MHQFEKSKNSTYPRITPFDGIMALKAILIAAPIPPTGASIHAQLVFKFQTGVVPHQVTIGSAKPLAFIDQVMIHAVGLVGGSGGGGGGAKGTHGRGGG